MQKEIPLLFSTSMISALLAGIKTVTRRIVKNEHVLYNLDVNKVLASYYNSYDHGFCPYGKPGGILYVREEYYQYGHWEEDNTRKRKLGRQAWKFVPYEERVLFTAPVTGYRKGRVSKDPYTKACHKRNSLFMPKEAARIWLQVESVRLERVQDISEADAIAEGVNFIGNGQLGNPIVFENYLATGAKFKHSSMPATVDKPTRFTAKDSFESLWHSINGAKSWASNPFVWRIYFRVLSTTGKPST